jgi:hypothetical protein
MLDWSQPAQKYLEEVKDFVQMAGIKNGSIPVIKRLEHSQQWREWYAYYKFRRLFGSMHIMEEKDQKTVPTLSPIDFDAEFLPPKFLPNVPQGGDNVPRQPGPTPLERKMERLRNINSDLPVLMTNVHYEQFKLLSRERQIPVGAKWSAALGIVYGPAPKQIQQAAE